MITDQARMQAWPSPRSLSHVLQTPSSPAQSVNSPLSSTLLLLLRYCCNRVRLNRCCRPQELNPDDALRSTSAASSTFTCHFRSGCALNWETLSSDALSFSPASTVDTPANGLYPFRVARRTRRRCQPGKLADSRSSSPRSIYSRSLVRTRLPERDFRNVLSDRRDTRHPAKSEPWT